MKHRISFLFIFLSALFICSAQAFAFVADNFDFPKTDHIVKRGDFIGNAKANARIPFVKSQIVKDAERGNVLQVSFNVSEGFGGTYIIFKKNHIPQNFTGIRFWIRGAQSAFKIELKDTVAHSYVVPKSDRKTWHQVTIPISEFSNHENLKSKEIQEFVLVFEDHRAAPRLGTLYFDDLSFIEERESERVKVLAEPGPVLVNGSISVNFAFRTENIDRLKLTTRLLARGDFKSIRFEASSNGIIWFYLAEFPAETKKEFEYVWNISSFPSGTYWLRAVTVSESGEREKGERSKVEIKNYFDFNRFLDETQRKTFDYFLEQADSRTYLIKDRTAQRSFFSTGLSGFQWTAYVIGVSHGWMDRKEALRRINISLDFFLHKATRYRGLLPHWLDSNYKEVWEIEMGDVVETSYVVAGGLAAKAYFDQNQPEEIELRNKIDLLIQDIEWDGLLKRVKPADEKDLLPWHWSRKKGASNLEIQGYNEGLISYILALGAPAHTVAPESWRAWSSTYQKGRYGPYELIACAPLFTHQYPHLWIDFRRLRDRHANYFVNSILATLANREYSLKENKYEPEIWGLSASDGPSGYQAYGAPPAVSSTPVLNDGTIAPTAAGTSIIFTPQVSLAALKNMKERYGEKIFGKYGFKDAFNLNKDWVSEEYLGLDEGAFLIAIENYRTGLIWRLMMKNPYIQEGLKRAGFQRSHRLADYKMVF